MLLHQFPAFVVEQLIGDIRVARSGVLNGVGGKTLPVVEQIIGGGIRRTISPNPARRNAEGKIGLRYVAVHHNVGGIP